MVVHRPTGNVPYSGNVHCTLYIIKVLVRVYVTFPSSDLNIADVVFCMMEYFKNVNMRYVIVMTFQLHFIFFFMEEYVYIINKHNEMTLVSSNMIYIQY